MNQRMRQVLILEKAIELVGGADSHRDEHWYLCHAIEGAAYILSGRAAGFYDSCGRVLPHEWRTAFGNLLVQVDNLLGGKLTLEGWIARTLRVDHRSLDNESVKATRLAWARWIKDQQ